MKPLPRETLERLRAVTDAEWRSIILRLTGYALHKVRRRHWRTPPEALPEGKEAADLVSQAIAAVWTGTRRWDPAADPDLLGFLESVVDSLVFHLIRSADHKTRPLRSEREESEERTVLAPSPGPNPEEEFVRHEEESEDQAMAEAIRTPVAGDDLLELVLLGIEEGKKPAEVSTDLGVERTVVYNAIRTINRRAEAVRRERRKGHSP